MDRGLIQGPLGLMWGQERQRGQSLSHGRDGPEPDHGPGQGRGRSRSLSQSHDPGQVSGQSGDLIAPLDQILTLPGHELERTTYLAFLPGSVFRE